MVCDCSGSLTATLDNIYYNIYYRHDYHQDDIRGITVIIIRQNRYSARVGARHIFKYFWIVSVSKSNTGC